MRSRAGSRAALALLLALLLWPALAPAQRLFGQNKVVYTDREWRQLQWQQVQLYFYEGEEELARQALAIAREAYVEFAAWFDHEFEQPLPLILYGTHHDFKQTHVTPGLIGEGTAGFTEFAKGRVVLRATGSYRELWHLVRHEMVHAFMLDLLQRTTSERRVYDFQGPPLWFIEGLAESLANPEPDTQAHMVMRDAVVNGGLVPIGEMWRIFGTFQMYKQGESIVDHMRRQYGDRIPALLLHQWWRGTDLADLLELELGLTLDELDEGWRAWMRRRYYPQLLERQSPSATGVALLQDPRAELAPAWIGGDAGTGRLACLSARSGGLNLFAVELQGRRRADFDLLVRTGQDDRFESVAPFRSRLDVHGERWLAFTAKAGARDAIYVYDLERREMAHRVSLRGVPELSSPSFSPDGKQVVVSGLAASGFSDLWVVELEGGEARALTRDRSHDVHPDWHPDGSRVVFASDRADPVGGRLALYELALEAGASPRRLTGGPGSQTEARWSPDGEAILHVDDGGGARDLHLLRDGLSTRLTALTGGAFHPDFGPAPGGGHAAYASVFHEGSFRLYRFPLEPAVASPPRPALAGASPSPDRAAPPVVDVAEGEAEDYEVDLGIDFVQSVVALDPDLPYGSGASVGLTDLLGEHQLFLHVGTAAQQLRLEDLNLGVSYRDLGTRWNRQFGLFRLSTVQQGLLGSLPRNLERRTGGFAGLNYPFSRFRRLELTGVLRHLERIDSSGSAGGTGTSWLASGFVSLVHDNTLWTWQGPQRGMRWNLTLGQTFDLGDEGFDRQTVQLDLRHYQPLPGRLVLATRGVQRLSFGGDRQLFPLYGRHDVRGYDFGLFQGDRISILNAELRLPALDRLTLGLPFVRLDFPPVRAHLFSDNARVSAGELDLGWRASYGMSLAMTLFPPIVIRYDLSRPHDWERQRPTDHWWGVSFLY